MKTLTSLFWVFSLAASIAAAAVLCIHDYSLALLLHLTAAVLGLGCCLFQNRSGRYIPFELAMALLIPCFGGFLCAFCAQRTLISASAGLASEYTRHIDPDEYRDPFSLKREIFRPHPDKLQPLSDIIHSAAPLSMKRTAIEALSQMETPEAVAVLRDALRMDSVEVRFFAASVLSRLEDTLTRKLRQLDKEKNSRDITVLLNTAQTYYDYAFYEIVEGYRKEACLQAAFEKAQTAISLSHTAQTITMCGRIVLALGRCDEALGLFNELITLRPSDATGYLWRAQVHLQRGDYEKLREDCLLALELGNIPVKMREAVRYWSGEQTA